MTLMRLLVNNFKLHNFRKFQYFPKNYRLGI